MRTFHNDLLLRPLAISTMIWLAWIFAGCQQDRDRAEDRSDLPHEAAQRAGTRLAAELEVWMQSARDAQAESRTIELGTIAKNREREFTLLAVLFPPTQVTPRDRCRGLRCDLLGTAFPLTLRLRSIEPSQKETTADYGATIVWNSQTGEGRIVLSNVFITPPDDAARQALYGQARTSVKQLAAITAKYLCLNGLELASGSLRYELPVDQVTIVHDLLGGLFGADLVEGKIRLIPTQPSSYGVDPESPDGAANALADRMFDYAYENWRDPSSGYYISSDRGVDVVDRSLREAGLLDPDAGVFPDDAQMTASILAWLKQGGELELVRLLPRELLARAVKQEPYSPAYNERRRGISDVLNEDQHRPIGVSAGRPRNFPMQYCDGVLRVKSTSADDVELMNWLLESPMAAKHFPDQVKRLKQFGAALPRTLPVQEMLNPETERKWNERLQAAIPAELSVWFFGPEPRQLYAAQGTQATGRGGR
jgi:hypothetical protein